MAKLIKQKTEKSRTGALDYEGTEAQSAALQSIKKYSQYDPDLINKAYNKDTGKIDLSGDVLKDAVVESLRQQAEAAVLKVARLPRRLQEVTRLRKRTLRTTLSPFRTISTDWVLRLKSLVPRSMRCKAPGLI